MTHRASFVVTLSVLGAGVVACGSSSDPDPANSGASGTETAGSSSNSGGNGSGAASSGGNGSGASGGTPSFEATTRVDSGSGTAVVGGADIAIAPDGTVYVSWVDEQGGARDVFVARSTDGGVSFGAAVAVDDAAIEPLVGMARHPYIAADDERVAVVFNDEDGTVYLYVSAAGGESLAFGGPTVVGSDVATDFRDFPKALFLDGGEIVVAWQGYPSTGARIFLSREDAGFDSEEASGGAPGVPCECCPLDLVQSAGGDLLTAFRNNDSNIREMWAARAPSAGAFSSWAPISSSEGMLDVCPMQGPRLAQTGASSHAAVWSGRGQATPGAVYFSTSADGGSSWSGGAPIPGFTGDEPTIAVGASGRVFVTGVTGGQQSSMVSSDDGGASWSAPEPLQAPDGALAVPQAEDRGGIAAIAAVSQGGTVWLRRME